jgi:hypothetical protein
MTARRLAQCAVHALRLTVCQYNRCTVHMYKDLSDYDLSRAMFAIFSSAQQGHLDVTRLWLANEPTNEEPFSCALVISWSLKSVRQTATVSLRQMRLPHTEVLNGFQLDRVH